MSSGFGNGTMAASTLIDKTVLSPFEQPQDHLVVAFWAEGFREPNQW